MVPIHFSQVKRTGGCGIILSTFRPT